MALTRHGHHIPGTGVSRNEQALADPQNCGAFNCCGTCIEDKDRVLGKLAELNVPLEED